MPVEQKFFNRDISWLSFNHRVLEEAKDTSLPLFERLKFLAIYSNNLDEFYKVRVAEYRNATQHPEGYPDIPDAGETLEKINQIVGHHWIEYSRIFKDEILPLMEKNKIILHLNRYPQKAEYRKFMETFFHRELIPYCQPVLLNKGTRSFMRDNRLYLALKLHRKIKKNDKRNKERRARYALIKVPTNDHNRFIKLPKIDEQHHFIFLDDALRFGLPELFPGYDVIGSWGVKIARNADLGIDDEFWGDLVEKIRKNLSLRKTGTPAGLYHDRAIPADVLHFLMDSFGIKPIELVETGSYQNLHDFFSFPNPYSPKLQWQAPQPIKLKELEKAGSMFEAIKRKERVLHYPYHSFDYVIRFLREAATNDKVEEIKVTQYRVASNSEVVGALIFAAHNKKKVTVFVEVKARFDEANNLYFARQMEKAGIKIIYSIPGLKVHAKMAMAIRRSNGVRKRSFAYLSTGNFNEKTARLYADHGFFTCNDAYLDDMEALFRYLENQSSKPELNKLLITQINLRKGIMDRINREIDLAKKGEGGYILLKMNGIQNKNLISKLYEAGQAGVKVDLIVRGICCLVPGYSENIRVFRLVDSYLEHARIWVFGNNNNKEMFLSSADWLNRNINRRIEIAFPLENFELKNEILTILEMQLNDNVKLCRINKDLENIHLRNNKPKLRAQQKTYEYLVQQNISSKKEKTNKNDTMLTLILVRHAKTEQLAYGSAKSDFERELKPGGCDDAKLLAKELVSRGIKPGVLITSKAVRANQTATILAKELGVDNIVREQFIYDSYTSSELITYLNRYVAENTVIMLVGHNPGIAMSAVNLSGSDYLHFPTAGCVAISFDMRNRKEINAREGHVEWFITPKMLK